MGGVGGVVIIPIPREATSVATMIGLFPVLNSFNTQSRSFCCLSPWMAAIFVSLVDAKVHDNTHKVRASHLGGGIE